MRTNPAYLLVRCLAQSVPVLIRFTALAALVTVASTVAATPAQAAPPSKDSCVRHGAAAGKEASAENIDRSLASMRARGVDADDVERALVSVWCLTKVSKDPEGGVAANGADSGDVSWTQASVYYDSQIGRYVAVVAYTWHNADYTSDVPYPGCYNSGIGGRDGIGIRLSGGEYAIYGYSASRWGRPYLDPYNGDYGFVSIPGEPSQVNQYGVGWDQQDNSRQVRSSSNVCMGGPDFADFDWYGGQAVLTVRALNGGCRSGQVFADYVHTWSSTGVSSISAGPGGWSISWSSGGAHNFQSQKAGGIATIC